MKKRLFFTCLITFVICLALAASVSAANKTLILKIGDPNMIVNGTKAQIDPGRGTKLLIVKGRTLVPIRAIVNQMGGNIAWDGKLRQVVIYANNKTIKMTLNNASASVKAGTGEWVNKSLDVAPQSIHGRTMVPLRFVTEQLGAKVAWDAKTKKITLTFDAVPLNPGSIIGAWETDAGIIVFTESGGSIVSTYSPFSLGTITGTFSGGRLVGKWYADELEQGDIVLTVMGNNLTGQYKTVTPTKSDEYTYPATPTSWTPLTGKRN